MKRLTKVLFIFLFFAPFLTNSQTYLGLTSGYIISNPHISNNSSPHVSGNLNYHNSFFISVDYREKHRERSSLGASISYSYQNTDYYIRTGGQMGSSSTDASFSYGYLDLYFYPEFSYGKKVQFYFNFGPCFGFLLHSYGSGTKNWIQYSMDTVPPQKGTKELGGNANEYLNGLTLGFRFGVGMRYALNDKINLHIDFSNRIGVMDLKSDTYANFLFKMFFAIGVELKIKSKNKQAKE